VLVEADIRLRGGRLEATHLKPGWPLPVLWDRWALAPSWRRQTALGELLAAVPLETELMLDLKGSTRRVAELVRDELQPQLGLRRLSVCARSWGLLDLFADDPVRRIHSVGSARGLRALLRRETEGARIEAVSIHERLLDGHVVASLRAIADVVMSWPVNRPERAIELIRLGVDGLITDVPDRILACLGRRAVHP
jgi:glycerophosphoryl diester phosphodiesterase